MSKPLFREKNLKKVNSPESLNDYVRVSNPGVWLLLAAVIALLAGAFVWGYFGRMESTVKAAVIVTDEKTMCFVRRDDIQILRAGMTVRVKTADGTVEGTISELAGTDHLYAESDIMELSNMVYAALLDLKLPAGNYEATVVTESVSPLSFLFN